MKTGVLDTQADLQESLDWLVENTNFPTFQEFAKNPDKWRARKDDLFEAIDRNAQSYNVFKHEYYWRGIYKVDSLEKIQKLAMEEGYEGNELEMEPIADRLLGDPNDYDKKITLRVNIYPKSEFKAMGGIVANES